MPGQVSACHPECEDSYQLTLMKLGNQLLNLHSPQTAVSFKVPFQNTHYKATPITTRVRTQSRLGEEESGTHPTRASSKTGLVDWSGRPHSTDGLGAVRGADSGAVCKRAVWGVGGLGRAPGRWQVRAVSVTNTEIFFISF